MSPVKVLITSGGGLLGQYLNLALADEFDILTFYHRNPGNATDFNHKQIDLADLEDLENVVLDYKPDVIIHNAAVSNPKLADELPRKYVYQVNVNATAKLAELSNKLNAKIIYTSTDLVYAGYRGSYLKEDSKLVPISFYAETKLMGEVKIKSLAQNFLILRTALLFGFGLNHSKNHFMETYHKLKNNESVTLFSDQFRSPLELSEAAGIIKELIQMDARGLLNFGGCERISRYQMGLLLCEVCGFNPELVRPIKMEELNVKYPVADVSMNVDKLIELGIKPNSVKDSLSRLFKG